MKDRKQDSSANHMPWVKDRMGRAYYLQSEPLEINAAPEVVWDLVKNIENYAKYSGGSVTAHVDGELKVDKTIVIDLYKHQVLGKVIPSSRERISVVDEKQKVIGWERVLPLGSGTTERYQVLEPINGGKKTMSYIALRIPGTIGFFTNASLKKSIEQAFCNLNAGIKKEAEAKQLMLNKK